MDSDAPVFRGNQEPSYISGSVNAGQKLQIGKHFSNVGSELPEYATTMNE